MFILHRYYTSVQCFNLLKVSQGMAKIKKIKEEQREKIPGQRRKEGEGKFLRKIVNTSGIQGVNAI